MAADSIVKFRPGYSPFDEKMRKKPGGREYWLGSEMQGPMGYVAWQDMKNVIRRAEKDCRNNGRNPSDHFRWVPNNYSSGKAGRPRSDVELSRYGCYLVALNGVADKPETAAAKEYFIVKGREAETGRAVPEAMVPTAKPWSVRFRETFEPHVQYVYMHYPRHYTVVTALVGPLLCLEDELVRHMFEVKSSDRPDVSIGLRWSHERERRGLARPEQRAPLYLPDQDREVWLLVYGDAEWGDFNEWFRSTYLPELLPDYFANKPEFKRYGALPPASAADNSCRRLTGSHAHLEPRVRRQLAAAGGFFPVGATLPALEGAQRTLFDMSG